jgi:hypothetical protein
VLYNTFHLHLIFILVNQEMIDYLARELEIRFEVLDNLIDDNKDYLQRLTISNKGPTTVLAGDWSVYFYHIRATIVLNIAIHNVTCSRKKWVVLIFRVTFPFILCIVWTYVIELFPGSRLQNLCLGTFTPNIPGKRNVINKNKYCYF